MVADECRYCHEDLCILPFEEKGGKCKYMVEKDIVYECTATNKDLVTACGLCETQPANAPPPFEEYCVNCGKELAKDYSEEELKKFGWKKNKGAEDKR